MPFALAVFMSLLFPRRRMVYMVLGWAVLNSYTRLYLGVHYPGDLLVGAIIGSAFGALCYYGASLAAPLPKAERLARTHEPLLSIPYIGAASPADSKSGAALTVKVFVIPASMTAFAVCAATLAYIILKSL